MTILKSIFLFIALTFGYALTIENVNAQTKTENATPQSFSRTFQTDLNKVQRSMGSKNRRDMRQNNHASTTEDDRTVGQSKTTNPQKKYNRRHAKKARHAPAPAQNNSGAYGSTLNN